VEEENVDDNHIKDPSDLSAIIDDEMESGVEDEGLASDHGIPSNSDECDRYVVVGPDLEELHEECE